MAGIDQHVRLAKNRFEARVESHLSEMRKERAEVHAHAGSGGFGRSSYVSNRMFEISTTAVQRLAKVAWDDLVYVCRRLGIEYSNDLALELKSAVRGMLGPVSDRIDKQYTTSIKGMPGSRQDLEHEFEVALKPIEADIEIFAAELEKAGRSHNPEEAAKNVLNFYSPVGTVVTGEYANVNIQYLKENRQNVIAAMQAVRSSVEAAGEDVPTTIAQLADEVEAEVQKDNPNPKRIAAALKGLGGAIQTIASMRPAYNAVKTVAALAGIPLP